MVKISIGDVEPFFVFLAYYVSGIFLEWQCECKDLHLFVEYQVAD